MGKEKTLTFATKFSTNQSIIEKPSLNLPDRTDILTENGGKEFAGADDDTAYGEKFFL